MHKQRSRRDGDRSSRKFALSATRRRKRWRQATANPFNPAPARWVPSRNTQHAAVEHSERSRLNKIAAPIKLELKWLDTYPSEPIRQTNALQNRRCSRGPRDPRRPMGSTLACFARLFSERTATNDWDVFKINHERHAAIGYA